MASGLHKQPIWVQVSLEGIKIIDTASNVRALSTNHSLLNHLDHTIYSCG